MSKKVSKKVLGSFVCDASIMNDMINAIEEQCSSFKILERRVADYEEIVSNPCYPEALARYASDNKLFEVVIFERGLTIEELDELTLSIALRLI